MNRIIMKCSAMLLALAAVAPAVSAGTIEFSYAVPSGLSLIRGTQQGTHVMRQPSAKAPRLMLVEMGEGWNTNVCTVNKKLFPLLLDT
ncbi:hypothetical protein [Sodaliphilus sp.]|uniref:hypothetical protein n=1 Tax=Sodaliphilus sp. TaxID=2815818 RepID=UPI00388F4E57